MRAYQPYILRNLYLTIVGVTFILALWGFLDFLKKGYR